MNLPKPELSKQGALQLWNTYHSEYAKEQMILCQLWDCFLCHAKFKYSSG